MASHTLTDRERTLQSELERRHNALREQMVEAFEASDEPHLNELVGRVRDTGDNSLATLFEDQNLSRYQHWTEEVNELERALADLRAGTYGICEDCRREISYERLLAEPTARRCLACQQRHERLYTDEADSL